MSDFIPNSFQTPNAYVDRLMAFLTNDEWKALCYMARRTFGFNKREDRISLSQMENGLTDSNGNQLDYGTGLSRPALVKALAGLKKYGVAREVAPNDPKRNEGALYAPQLDISQVDIEGLYQRERSRLENARQKTQAARVVVQEKRNLGEAIGRARLVPDDELGRPGLVYLASSGLGLCKIGISTNPQKRIAKLNAQSPLTITLLHSFPADDMARAESQLHQLFETKRRKGEWFALSEDETNYIKTLKRYSDGRFWSE